MPTTQLIQSISPEQIITAVRQLEGSEAMWVIEVSGLAVLNGLPVLAYHPHCIPTHDHTIKIGVAHQVR